MAVHCAQMLNAPTMNMHIEFDTLCDNNDDNGTMESSDPMQAQEGAGQARGAPAACNGV